MKKTLIYLMGISLSLAVATSTYAGNEKGCCKKGGHECSKDEKCGGKACKKSCCKSKTEKS